MLNPNLNSIQNLPQEMVKSEIIASSIRQANLSMSPPLFKSSRYKFWEGLLGQTPDATLVTVLEHRERFNRVLNSLPSTPVENGVPSLSIQQVDRLSENILRLHSSTVAEEVFTSNIPESVLVHRSLNFLELNFSQDYSNYVLNFCSKLGYTASAIMPSRLLPPEFYLPEGGHIPQVLDVINLTRQGFLLSSEQSLDFMLEQGVIAFTDQLTYNHLPDLHNLICASKVSETLVYVITSHRLATIMGTYAMLNMIYQLNIHGRFILFLEKSVTRIERLFNVRQIFGGFQQLFHRPRGLESIVLTDNLLSNIQNPAVSWTTRRLFEGLLGLSPNSLEESQPFVRVPAISVAVQPEIQRIQVRLLEYHNLIADLGTELDDR